MSSPVQPLTVEEERAIVNQSCTYGYWLRVLIAFDTFCNVLLFHGRLDETISAHAGRSAQEGHLWGTWMCKFLNLFQKNHGAIAEASDLGRAKAIVETEEQSPLLPEIKDV